MSDDDASARAKAVAAKLLSSAPATLSSARTSTRKLLHWTPEQWQAFESTPRVAPALTTLKPRLFPIRAPLSSIYEIHFSGQASYTPSTLMEQLIANARGDSVVSVGMVIDATGQDYFLHDTKEWEDWEVEYVKLRVDIPEDASEQERQPLEDEMLKAFCKAIESHKAGDNADLDVAVFGANGYNFVGFLIVSYLVEHCDRSLDAALKEFASVSPPGIYSRYYLERLYRKYFSTLASPSAQLSIPTPPKWDADAADDSATTLGSDILTEEDQLNKFVRTQRPNAVLKPIVASGSSSNGPSPRTSLPLAPVYKPPPAYNPPLYIPPDRSDADGRPAKRRKIRSWMDDVQPLTYGETLETSTEEHVTVIKALEKLTGIEGFPGCEAIPLTATHVAEGAYKHKSCLTKAYLVTWRARGRRCLLFVTADSTYVVSRDMTFTKVNMKFPRRRAAGECQKNTLIDGIIVEDEDHGRKVARYLAFDILFVDGNPVWQKKLEKRLQCLQNEVILPRKNDPSFDYTKEPFRVRMKDHFRLAKTEYLLQKFVKSVTHEVDGVIYTPTEAAYNLGGFECEEPIFKFVASEDGGIPGLDGSISERRLLHYVQSIPA